MNSGMSKELIAKNVFLYLRMKDGETKEDAMERLMDMMADADFDFQLLEEKDCEVRYTW